jgi:PST family polysaccharide transporter
MSILTSWWYARKVKVARVRMGFQETAQEAGALLRLGFVFMSTGLMTQGVAYLARVLILRSISLEAVGCYHAAWVFGGLYFGFILQAMGADFYPRLTAVARDNPQCNRLVNEQAEVGLLLGVPGLLATLALAPVVIHVFYSSKFGLAIEILRWICLGMVMRVACWPMGFILLAKGEGKVFFVTEVVANALQVSLIWLGLRWFSLPGTGMAFFALYVIYALGIYLVVRRMSGFRWSAANRRIGLIYGPLVAGVFVSFYFLPAWAAVALGVVASIAAGVYSVRLLCGLVSADKLPGPLIKGLRFLRLIS